MHLSVIVVQRIMFHKLSIMRLSINEQLGVIINNPMRYITTIHNHIKAQHKDLKC